MMPVGDRQRDHLRHVPDVHGPRQRLDVHVGGLAGIDPFASRPLGNYAVRTDA
jgi:hypothetical protein